MTTYRSKASKLYPGKLKATDYKNIGRLIRACAEVDNCLSLFLFELADVDRQCGIALIGKSSAATRYSIALKLAGANTDLAQKLRECFVLSGHKEAVDTRNTVAHGTFMGLDDAGLYCFETENWDLAIEAEDRVFYTQLVSLSSAEIKQQADATEKLIPFVERTLGLRASRRKLRQQPVLAHPKSRRPKRGPAKP